ncbi:MAG: response regulator [Verrucomicrobia bacterium]|jgi:CheY-like chemotaxis protein|nr:response regulator [Verrucomicrobiota bacterium]
MGGSGLVLIAEDHAPNAEILADFCALERLRTKVAGNGLEAVEMARQYAPQLVLMDWRMPVLEGPAAIRQLKADPRTRRLPVVALTAYAQPRDQSRMVEVGAAGFLTKPVNFDRRHAVLVELGLCAGRGDHRP